MALDFLFIPQLYSIVLTVMQHRTGKQSYRALKHFLIQLHNRFLAPVMCNSFKYFFLRNGLDAYICRIIMEVNPGNPTSRYHNVDTLYPQET